MNLLVYHHQPMDDPAVGTLVFITHITHKMTFIYEYYICFNVWTYLMDYLNYFYDLNVSCGVRDKIKE
jgi:uncharacterized protein (DUF983 family)